jgi:hypothetical protein
LPRQNLDNGVDDFYKNLTLLICLSGIVFMPINSCSGLATSPITRDERQLIRKSNSLSNKLTQVSNSISEFRLVLDQKVKAVNLGSSWLKKLDGISQKHSEDACVRMKGDRLKFGLGSHFLKNLMHGGRYRLERDKASDYFRGSVGNISVSDIKPALCRTVEEMSLEVSELRGNINKYQVKSRDLDVSLYEVEQKLRVFADAREDAIEAEKRTNKLRDDFAIIYHCNVGSKEINKEARYQFANGEFPGDLKGRAVVAEYTDRHTDEIFGKGNKDLVTTISVRCKGISTLVAEAARVWYTPRGGEDTTTYRGQGLTQKGIDLLIEQFKADQAQGESRAYKLGQFFSTSSKPSVAIGFANKSKDSIKVMFTVSGNSANGVIAKKGLAFEGAEYEALYSPLSNFKVTSIKPRADGNYEIGLKETTRDDTASVLPY